MWKKKSWSVPKTLILKKVLLKMTNHNRITSDQEGFWVQQGFSIACMLDFAGSDSERAEALGQALDRVDRSAGWLLDWRAEGSGEQPILGGMERAEQQGLEVVVDEVEGNKTVIVVSIDPLCSGKIKSWFLKKWRQRHLFWHICSLWELLEVPAIVDTAYGHYDTLWPPS